jgi:hypothetical protein
VLSVLLYFLAVATYSLQVTMLLAIPILAVARYGGVGPGVSWRKRIGLAALDTAFYGFALALFLAIWIGARSESHDAHFTLSLAGIQDNASQSIRLFLWHNDYTQLVLATEAHWRLAILVPAVVVSITAFAVLFSWVSRTGTAVRQSEETSSAVGPGAYQPSLLATIAQTVAVAIALALGTILVESLASEVWPPGHRSRMIRQVAQPLLFGSVVFAIAFLAERLRPRLGRFVAIGGMAALCTFAFVGTLENNRLLNTDTAVDQRVISALKRMIPVTNRPVTIVLIPDGTTLPKWNAYISDEYVQTEFGSPFLYTRVLHTGPPVTEWTDYDSVVFGPDRQGVFMMSYGMTTNWVPYSDILFVRYDGQTVSRLDTVTAEDVAGFRVAFQRDGPITTTLNPETLTDCPANIDFDIPVVGTGWSEPEISPDGTTFTWMNSVKTTLDLGMAIERQLDFEAKIHTVMAPDILESVQFSVNGQPVLTEVRTDANGSTVVRGTIPASGPLTKTTKLSPVILVAIGRTSELGITVNRTVIPEGGNRTLGIAFDSIRFRCASDESSLAATATQVSGQGVSEAPVESIAASSTPASASASPTAAPSKPQELAPSITSATCPPRRDSPAAEAACLAANPNPVSVRGGHGSTTIAWSTGNADRGATGQIYLSKDGRPEILFYEGNRGTVKARIRAGSVYEFRLYSGTERGELLTSLIVSTIEGRESVRDP